jgi:hypothetical protein
MTAHRPATAVTSHAAPGPPSEALDAALEVVAAGAATRDRAPHPQFPHEPIDALRAAGALSWNAVAGVVRPAADQELSLVRRIAAADGSVGRIADGHLNAVERLAVQAPPEIRDSELARVRAGELLLGVWGGDPVPGEGPPAAIRPRGLADGEVLRGVKTFCSGAGGVQRALVLVRDGGAPDGPPVLAYVDLTDPDRVKIDTSWYRSHGLVASVSHRVVFHDAPVITRVGEPGAIAVQPWFGRDALRTAASWAGMADTAVDGALTSLAERRAGDLEALAAGRILAARHTIDVWLAAAAAAMDAAVPGLADVALNGRVAIAVACRAILDEGARACGSRPFATAQPLDRARRDLEVFLLQHRLDPMLARRGAAALKDASRPPAAGA